MITSILLAKILNEDQIFTINDKTILLQHDSTLYQREKIQGYSDFTRPGSSAYVIVIDADMVRRDWGDNVYRFILAHEIGHILNKHVDDMRGNTWGKERVADCFAVKALDKAGLPGVKTAISFYNEIVDHPASGKPGGTDHIAFVKSCDI